MAASKFKPGHKVVYKLLGQQEGYSNVFTVITQKEWLDLTRRPRIKKPQHILKEIKVKCKQDYNCKPIFMKADESPTWMPENKLIPYTKAFGVLYAEY